MRIDSGFESIRIANRNALVKTYNDTHGSQLPASNSEVHRRQCRHHSLVAGTSASCFSTYLSSDLQITKITPGWSAKSQQKQYEKLSKNVFSSFFLPVTTSFLVGVPSVFCDHDSFCPFQQDTKSRFVGLVARFK